MKINFKNKNELNIRKENKKRNKGRRGTLWAGWAGFERRARAVHGAEAQGAVCGVDFSPTSPVEGRPDRLK